MAEKIPGITLDEDEQAPAGIVLDDEPAAPARQHPDNWMGDVAQFMDDHVAADPSSTVGAFRRGAGQGISLGLGDEIAGAFGAAGHMAGSDVRRFNEGTLANAIMAPKDRWDEFVGAYEKYRDEVRNANKQAKEQHSTAYGAGEVAGNMPLAVSGTGLAGTIAVNAGMGAVRGAGENENPDDLISDVATGTVAGGAGGALGYGAGRLVGAVAKPVANRLMRAESGVAHDIANEAAAQGASAMGKAMQPLSREAAEAGRHVENILEHMATLDDQGRFWFMRSLPPNVRAEVGAVIQEQVDKAGQYLGNRVRPVMQTPRSASSFAEELASPMAGVKQGGKELVRAVRNDLKHIPGLQTGAAVLKGARRTFSSNGAKLSALQQMRLSLSVDPARWGRFTASLAEASDAGEQAFAATDYLLSQSDPEYRALKRSFDAEDSDERR